MRFHFPEFIISKKVFYFFVIILTCIGCTSNDQLTIDSKNGIIDISEIQYDFTEPKTIKGDVLFYWQQWPLTEEGEFNASLLKTEDKIAWDNAIWTSKDYKPKGFGTYRFYIKNNSTTKAMVFKTSNTLGAIQVWINGIRTESHGQLSKDGKLEKIDARPLEINLPDNEFLDVMLLVSNHQSALGGGFLEKSTLQEKNSFTTSKKKKVILEGAINFVIILFGISLIIVFFLTRRRSYFLFLGVFCLCAAIKQWFSNEALIYNFFPRLSFNLVEKARIMCYYIAIPSIILYYNALFPKYFPRKLLWFFVCVYLLGAFLTLISPTYIITFIFPYFQPFGFIVVPVVLYQIIKAVIDKKPFAIATLIILVINSLFFVNNLLNELQIIKTGLIINTIILVFILFQSYMSYRIYTDTEKSVESMSSKIKGMQNEMELKQSEISKLLHESYHHMKSKEKIVDNLKEIASTSNNGSIRGIINNLRSELIEDHQLNSIRNEIEMLNYEFSKRLKEKHPDFSATDLEICSYLRIGLNRKEIARLRYTSIDAVKKSRYRVRKKLALEANDDLDEYLKSF